MAYNLRTYTLEGGERIYAHLKKDCLGPPCTIHARTDHAMRSFPQHWRSDRGIMERICPVHGCGHPDPDDYRVRTGLDGGIHGCCGACAGKAVCFVPRQYLHYLLEDRIDVVKDIGKCLPPINMTTLRRPQRIWADLEDNLDDLLTERFR